MRVLSALFCVLLIAACAPPEQTPEPTDADPEPALTLTDFAGTWDAEVTLEGVEEPVQTQLEGSTDGSEWTMILEGRDPIPLSATVAGDSLITESDPYESILRPGTTTRVRTANVLQGENMSGTVRVAYDTDEGQEIVRGTIEATRVR